MTDDNLHRSPDCPAGSSRQDRRGFLKDGCGNSGGVGHRDKCSVPTAPADKPKSDATPMPQISLGKYSISRLIVGCHNIDGGSHMSPFLDREMHDYYTPERAVKTLRRCEEVGINAWQGHERGTLLGIYNRYRQSGGKMYLLRTHGLGRGHPSVRQDRRADRHRPSRGSDRLAVQAGKTRRRPRPLETHPRRGLAGRRVHPHARRGRCRGVEGLGRGLLPDVRLRAAPRRGCPSEACSGMFRCRWARCYLKSDPPRMFKAIRQTKRPCLAFKILAAGRRHDVEQAFQETFAGIKPTDAVIVGIYDRYSDQAGQNAALARRFGSRS